MRLFAFTLSLAALGSSWAQELPRTTFHGFFPAPLEHSGCVVQRIATDGMAKRAGLMEGDTLIALDDPSVGAGTEWNGTLPPSVAGTRITYTVLRNGEKKKLSATAVGRPLETAADLDYSYTQVAHADGAFSAVLTRPKDTQAALPAVLFIQGCVCNSVVDLPEWHPYRAFTDALARGGYVVMRVEKPGIGDSRGTPACADIDLHEEAAAFASALKQCQHMAGVDSTRLYIMGHSLGGIIVPMIADAASLKAIATYGTSHLPWLEYFFQMLRTQGTYAGADPLQLETNMRSYHRLLYALFVEQRTPQALAAMDPTWGRALRDDFKWDGGRRLLGRDVRMYWDFNTVDLSAAWHAVSVPVLSMYGTADMEVMSPDPSQQITRMVDHGHPGNGTFRSFPGTNHSFIRTGSMELEYASADIPAY